MNFNYLKIPLNKLYYIDDISKFSGLTKEELDRLKIEYSKSEIQEIIDSVRWAVQNPDYEYSSLLPGLPCSNNEIYKYLCILERSLTNT